MALSVWPLRSSRPETIRADFALLALLLAVAAWLRLWGLGSLSLQVDEGVQALAVEGWLRSGLPILPSGAVYQRSIPFMALQALAANGLGLDEFALRLPAALFGVAAVAVTFALAWSLFDRRVAWLAAIFIALSAWEIELSRYARFYTAFQASYLLALLCFFRGMAPGAWRWRWGFVASAVAAITLHELAVALATCFLIPLLDRTSNWRTRVSALAAMVPFVVTWRVYRRTAGPWLASQAPPHALDPVVIAEQGEAGARVLRGVPAIPLPETTVLKDVVGNPSGALLALVAVLALVVVLIVHKEGRAGWRRSLLLVAAIAFGVVHQFLLVALALLAYLVWHATSLRTVWSRPLWPVYAAVAGSLLYWVPTLWGRLGGDWKATTLALFGFPNLLQHFVYWFAVGWPVFLVLVSVAAVAMFARYLASGNRSLLFVPAAAFLPVLAASAFQSYQESRYVFHVYPLLVILFSWGALRVVTWLDAMMPTRRSIIPRTAALGTLLACAILITGDVGPLTWAPMSRTYSTPRDPMRSVISWRAYAGIHQDQAGAATFVRGQAEEGEGVAAIGVPHQLAVYRFYLGRLDVALSRPQDAAYQRMRGGRVVDWVTGAELVWNPAELAGRLPGGTGWLVGDEAILRDDVTYLPEDVRREGRRVAGDVRYRGRDGITFVAKLP